MHRRDGIAQGLGGLERRQVCGMMAHAVVPRASKGGMGAGECERDGMRARMGGPPNRMLLARPHLAPNWHLSHRRRNARATM